jgi:hypothetical protein
VTLSTLQTILTVAAIMAASVFVAAFKVALREATTLRHLADDPDLPRAELHGIGVMSRNPWHRGSGKQWLIRQVHYLQAALVAFGITAVFVMFLCILGIIASMLIGHV